MSRVPTPTRDLFVKIADEEFCGDYGLLLKAVLDGYFMWKIFFENTDMKLDIIKEQLDSIVNLVNKEEINEQKPEGKRLLNGRIV